MGHSRSFPIWRDNPYLAEFRQRGCENRQTCGLDAVVIGNENAYAAGRHKKSCARQLILSWHNAKP